MSTTVSPCPNRKTWDATVRVTGGHPQQLWGIGQAQISAEGPGLQVDRVMVHDAEQRTVGYAQLYLRPEAERTVAGTVHAHVHRPQDLPVVAEALAVWAREEHAAELLRFQPDTLRGPGTAEALAAAGFARPATDGGPDEPRRLEVLLGETQQDLSRRLCAATLDRCRAALRTPDTASSAERRPLAQPPELSASAILSGDYAKKAESAAPDQFPLRETFRRIRALVARDVLGQKDVNGLYTVGGYAAKLEYPQQDSSLDHAAERFQWIVDNLVTPGGGSRVFLSVIPDKGAFLAEEKGPQV